MGGAGLEGTELEEEEQARGTAFQSACTSQLAIAPSTLLVSGCSSVPRQCLIANFLSRGKNISFNLDTHLLLKKTD